MPTERRLQEGNKDDAAVCFSGGKDSVAVALRLRRKGYDVKLAHIAGMNRATAAEETEATEALAKALNMPVSIMAVKQIGKMGWVENPIRNNFILALTADIMVPRGVRTFALGTMLSHKYDPKNADTGLSDAVEIIDATADALAGGIRNFEVLHLLKSNSDSMREVINIAPELLPIIRSCLTRKVWRTAHRNRIQKKYGVKLMEGRCGICQKCASEWLHMLAFGMEKENAGMEEYSGNVLHRRYEEHYIGRKTERADALAYFLDAKSVPELSRFL